MPSRRTMAPVCRLRLPRWLWRPFIWSNTPRKCFWTVARPCWLRRGQPHEACEAHAPAGAGWTAGPESGRGAARCIGMVAVVMLATAVDDRLSNSSRVDRPPWPPRSHRAKTQVLLLALIMLFQSVKTSRREYVSEIYVPATHPVSLRPPTKRSRIQEAPKWLNLTYTATRGAF